MPLETDSDENLIREAQNGSEDAFNQLVRRHQEPICRIIYRWVGDIEEARDIAQDVFLQAYYVIPKWKFKAKFFTWLYQTALNMARSSKRKANKVGQLGKKVNLTDDHQRNAPGVEMLNAELKEQVSEAIQNLPDRQRQVVLLRVYEQLSVQQTASIMKCREGTVKALLYQALQQLSVHLNKEAEHGQVRT